METSFAARDTEARLLSPLRARRFDLLLHLIANLEQPLAVCGPEGSGKTTFLHLLGQQAPGNWRIVPLDTAVRLTAQQAQDAILAALDGGDPGARRDLDALVAELARSGQLAVVVLDDAGRLPPRTLAELHRLARRFPVLRLVLALRPEEARVRASTNAGLFDDCHFIEVPPLDEAQCGDFLQQLAHAPPRLLGQGDITPDFIARVFRGSGGIPGRILQRLSVPAGKKRAVPFGGEFVWLGVLGLSFAAALLVTAWIWHGREVETEPPVAGEPTPSPVAETPPSAPAEPVVATPETVSEAPAPPAVPEAAPPSPEPLVESKPLEVPAESAPPPSGVVTAPLATPAGEARSEAQPPSATPPQPAAEAPGTEPVAPSPPAPPQKAAEAPKDKPAKPPAGRTADAAGNKPAKDQKAKEQKKESQANPQGAGLGQPSAKMSLPAGVSGPGWLVAQDAAAWSLQVMSARDPASIAALQKRYPGLKGLSAYRVTRKGKAMYPVYYGLFPNEEEARHAAGQLPESLGKAVPRRLGDIQRDVGAGIKAE